VPHGLPDWGLVGPKQTVYGLDDVGEAVVRLGSPVVWDRRGDVIEMVTFDRGLEGLQVVPGLGATYDLYSGNARHGALSLRTTTAAIAGSQVHWYEYVPVSIVGAFGVEISFAMDTQSTYMYVDLLALSSDISVEGGIRVNFSTADIAYLSSTGVWTDFTNVGGVVASMHHWHTIKLVIDVITSRYVRLILDDLTWDLTAYNLRVVPGTQLGYVRVDVRTLGSGAAVEHNWYDGLIITQNEPV